MGIVHLTTAGGHKWAAPVSQIVNWHEPVPGLEAPGAKCVVITQNEKIAVRETPEEVEARYTAAGGP